MKENLIIIGVFILIFVVIWIASNFQYKYVSACFKDEYREKWKAQRTKAPYQAFYCLNCKHWCDLIEVRVKEE